MLPVDVMGVRLQLPDNAPVVLLKEREGDRVLPIWIGAAEAAAIAFGLEGQRPERPLTHDLLLDVIASGGAELERVEITAMVEHVFLADLVLSDGRRVTARPSDAVALAVRVGCPVHVAPAVMDDAAIVASEEDQDEETADVDLEQFRAFLDTVSPEDFGQSES
ncbi:MAG: bifunctional nuclease family protein [Actinomycetales bacterium]|nr:bifunctional nuclease family protein [Actinomycetales bacterium]